MKSPFTSKDKRYLRKSIRDLTDGGYYQAALFVKRIEVHLLSQSSPMTILGVINTYTKDGLFCVLTDAQEVLKFPLCNIFRIKEPY
jgi:hypothetical protein